MKIFPLRRWRKAAILVAGEHGRLLLAYARFAARRRPEEENKEREEEREEEEREEEEREVGEEKRGVDEGGRKTIINHARKQIFIYFYKG